MGSFSHGSRGEYKCIVFNVRVSLLHCMHMNRTFCINCVAMLTVFVYTSSRLYSCSLS